MRSSDAVGEGAGFTRRAEALRACVAYPVLFFFQAEDGIRDLTVTGVQTCALPIWRLSGLCRFDRGDGHRKRLLHWPDHNRKDLRKKLIGPHKSIQVAGAIAILREIGRASCRERV